MSQRQSEPTRYKCSGVEFMIWNDNLEAGPDGWTVFPRDNSLAVLQYRDVSKGDVIEDIERRMDGDEWPESDDRDEEERATKLRSERLTA